ncbi:hypothetical protein NLI96_g11 [Meripilus lineatus]|uniref:F-box domain-containing protein n=1 Tax=Meripilus lineatus TaxID=2056292 RepID=A0AAD5VH79_9APHY|nr:hypothetical protein NLI96_g11 [Physisporinus lineatus]
MDQQGGLEGFIDMPVEIVAEALQYLWPMDLLSLTMTSKEFRKFLTQARSKFVWKLARQNAEFDVDCPRVLNEPQFANLVFNKYCHICKKPDVGDIDWNHFTRVCEKCYEKFRGNTSDAEFVEHYRTAFQERRKDAAACEEMHSQRRIMMSNRTSARYIAIKAKLSTLGWGEELEKPTVEFHLRRDPRVCLPILLTEQEWKTLESGLNDLMAKIQASQSVKQHWSALRPRFQYLALAISSLRRQESLKLQFARARDMASFPEFRKIIESPPDVNVTQKSFEKLRPLLPAMLSDWTTQVERLLRGRVVDILAAHGIPIPTDRLTDGLDPLSLAIAFMFICKDCKTGRQFPEVISHSCSLQKFHNCEEAILENDSVAGYEWCASEVLGEGDGIQNRVDLAVEAAVSVIKMYGYDPSEVTAETMDQSDIRLTCRRNCRQRWVDQVPEVMHWRRAITHAVFEHKGTYTSREDGIRPPVWKVASKEEVAKAREKEKSGQAGWQPSASDNAWVCNHCNNPDLSTKEDLQSHLRIGHSVKNPTDSDIRCDPHCGVLYAKKTKKPQTGQS